MGPTSPGYLRFLALFALAFVLARGTGLGLHVASIERWEEWAGWAPLTLVAALLMALAAAREYLRGVASGRYRAAPERVPVYRRRFRLQAALVAAIIVTLLYPWPALLRFYVSWPWLDAERRAILPGEQRHWPTFVGAYRIMRVAGAADEYVWFQYEESDFGARCGVAFYAREPDLVRVPSGGNRIWVAPGWYLEQW